MQFRLDCQHSNLCSRNCLDCGIYIYKEMKVWGVKTSAYTAPYPGDTHTHVNYLRKQSLGFEKCIPQFCLLFEVRSTIQSLVEVLGLTRETEAQALYIYQIAAFEMVKKKCYDQKYTMLYTATSLVLAAKRVHTERTIPPMEGIKRILQCNYAKKELCKAERLILRMLNFQVPNFTFLDFLNFYLLNGGVFSNEHFRDASKFQSKIDGLAMSYIKDASFLQYDQEALAIYILYRSRRDLKVSEVWNWHIEYYTQVNGERLKIILESMDNSPRIFQHLDSNRQGKVTSQQRLLASDRALAVSNIPRDKNKVYNKFSVEESIQHIKRGYSNLKRERSNSNSHCQLQHVRTGSSLNRFAFRVT